MLFVRILNPVPHMSWLACVWKTVIRLPMFPVNAARVHYCDMLEVGHNDRLKLGLNDQRKLGLNDLRK